MTDKSAIDFIFILIFIICLTGAFMAFNTEKNIAQLKQRIEQLENSSTK